MPGPGDWYAVRRYQKETSKKWTELLEEQNRRQHAMFDELIAEAKKERDSSVMRQLIAWIRGLP